MDGKLSYGPKVTYDSRVASGLSRGPTKRRLMNAAVWSNTWPVQNATLDLDFANDRGFVRGRGQGRVMDALTYNRFSSATYFDKDGSLKTAFSSPPLDYQATTSTAGSVNRFLNSQNFAAASWTKTGLTVALEPTVLAPDGVSQATRITESSGAITEALISSGGTAALINNTISVFAKEIPGGQKRYIYIGMRSDGLTRWSWIIYDLERQEYTSRGDGIQNAVVGGNITPLANGWYRISAIVTSPLAAQVAAIGITSSFAAPNSYNFGGYTGDGVSGMYIWGAQSELTPTNAVLSVPRYDYHEPVTVKPKNYITFSEDYSTRSSSGFGAYREGVRLTAQTIPTETISTIYGNLPFFALTEDTTATSDHYFTIGRNNTSDGFNPWPVGTTDPVTFSLIFKRGARRYLIIRQYSSTPFRQVLFDFDNPNNLVYSSSGGAGNFTSGSVESLGNDVYRISLVTSFVGGGTNSFAIFGADNTGSPTYTGNNSIIAYVSGMQFEEGSVATPYVVTSYAFAAYDQTISPTSNGLLIEEGRINYALWCRDLTNSAWTKQNMSAFRDQVGLDGISNTATRLLANATNATVTQSFTLGSANYTGSVYIKRLSGSGNIQLTVDGTRWSTIQVEANKWKRISLTAPITNPTIGIRIVDANDSVVVDYMQLEGGTFMSSPIFTTGVAASRGSDVTSIFNPTFDQFFNQREGTFYIEFDILGEDGSADTQSMISVSTSSNSFFTYFVGLDERNFVGFLAPSYNYGGGYEIATNTKIKSVVSYGRKYHGALNNGGPTTLINTNASGYIASFANLPYDRFGIGFQIRNPSSYNWMQGRIKRIVYVPYSINPEADFTLIGDK
jgi:hypothetical protein